MIVVVGYDGSPLSEDAEAVLLQADLVVGGARHLAAVDAVVRPGTDRLEMGPVAPAVAALLDAEEHGRRSVVLASGDPGFFGILRLLSLAGLTPVVLPGVSSIARAFALAGLPWTDAEVVTVHGREPRQALNVVRRGGVVAVLTSPQVGPSEVAAVLTGPDRRGQLLFVGERLGEQDQRFDWFTPEEAVAHGPWLEPNVVIAVDIPRLPAALGAVTAADVATAQAPWRLGPDREPEGWALPDSAFEHRDAMISKAEVRAVVLARLGPRPGLMVWDVGAGSGSVGIECGRFGAAVVLVEQDPDQADRARRNARRHGLLWQACRVVVGEAPEALLGLPQPDAVFVGGGGPDVVAAVAAVRPRRVVVALATLERVGPTMAALEGYDVDTVLVQVQHLRPLGDGHRLVPANPVFVVSGVLA